MGISLDSFVDKVQELRPAPPKSLYHYCPAKALKYLVHNDSDIWCTHCNHLNDPEECWTGIRLFLSYVKEKSILPNHVFQILDQSIRENSLLNKVLAKEGHSPIMPFSFSFSEVAESEKMWAYSDRNGYRIEFDADRIEQNAGRIQSILSKLNPKKRMSLSLWPCFYEESNRKEIASLFDAYIDDTKFLLEALTFNPNDEAAMHHLILSLLSISPIFKAEGWSYEKEWRLIMVREDFNSINWSNHRARSYLSSSNGGIRGFIKSFRPCPLGDIEWLKAYLEYELRDGFRGSENEFL